jgi:elongation factor 2
MAQVVPETGLVATGRLFSGSIREEERVYLVEADKDYRVRQVSIYMGAFREAVKNISAGNIAAVSGLDMARAGYTLVDYQHKDVMVPFERVKYVAEPVMTVNVEPKKPGELPKVIEAMNRLSIEDPNLVTTIDEETGQYLMSGIGELHLEIATNFLRQYVGDAEFTVSSPNAAYRETVATHGRIVMARSPNKRNKFWIAAKPLESKLLQQIEKAGFSEQAWNEKIENLRWGEQGNVWAVDQNRNVLIDLTQDAQYLQDAKTSIIAGFHWVCRNGPLCEEPLRGVQINLAKAQLSPNADLRESAQITRAVSRAILGSCLTAKPTLLEPIYRIEVSVKAQWFGECASIISRRRGKILSVERVGFLATICGYIPVAETFGLSAEMRSATSGYAFWQLAFDHWDKVPEDIAPEVIKKLRRKRGLPEEVPKARTFVDEV